jgi:hypothetical protein
VDLSSSNYTLKLYVISKFHDSSKYSYMIMSRHQNSGQNQNVKTANESFENMAKFKYLWTILTNQNDIHDKIKSRLNSGDACCHTV